MASKVKYSSTTVATVKTTTSASGIDAFKELTGEAQFNAFANSSSLLMYKGNIVSNTYKGNVRTWVAKVIIKIEDIIQSGKKYAKITLSVGLEATHSGTITFSKDKVTSSYTITGGGVNLSASRTSPNDHSGMNQGEAFYPLKDREVLIEKKNEAFDVSVVAQTVSTNAWGGTSTVTIPVHIESKNEPVVRMDAERINFIGSTSDIQVRIILETESFNDSATISTGDVMHTITSPRIANGTIYSSGTWYEDNKAVSQLVIDGRPHRYTKTITQSGGFSKLRDYGFKMAVNVTGYELQYHECGIEGTDGVFTTTFVVDHLPEVRPDGTARFNIRLMNYETGQMETASYPRGLAVDDNRDGTATVTLPLKAKYVSSLTDPSPDVQLEWSFNTYDSNTADSHSAFFSTTRNTTYSNGLANCVFVGGCIQSNYSSRVWYSELNNPLYFPETNYIEVGSNDTAIMGLTKIGEYLGIIKQGATNDASIYIAYPTSFSEDTAYAVKPSVNGIGACSRYAFNILNDEQLFLSKEGVMAISLSEDDDKKLRNRSYYIDGKLLKEKHLNEGYSFVWKGFYLLAVPNDEDNGHVYLLDGSQRNSWGNDKTNLVYECYYWDNVPAKAFASYDKRLWFSDGKALCRFKTEDDTNPYNDNGQPIKAVWSTILDDDGSVHYQKNLQKKGCVASVMPVGETSVKLFLKKDTNEPVLVKDIDTTTEGIPSEVYVNKKVKKYKRLQFILENDVNNQPFGIDQIIKSYTIGNYSKK